MPTESFSVSGRTREKSRSVKNALTEHGWQSILYLFEFGLGTGYTIFESKQDLIPGRTGRTAEEAMGFNDFIFYLEANVICVIMLLIILITDYFHSTQQEKQVWFKRALVANILYFASDIGWAAVLAGQLPKTRALVVVFNLLNYILLSLMAFEWFMFMAASEKMDFRKSRKKRRIWFLPMVFSAVVMVAAYCIAPAFWIGEDCEVNAWYYPMMISVPAFYLTTAFVFSMINARKTQSRDDRTLYRLIGIYPIGVMTFGILQVVSLSLPVFCFGCTIMLQCFYTQNLHTMISVDALTRLNNRGQIDRFMDQVRYRENAPVIIMMVDIDRFKEINDTKGHDIGDSVLKKVASVLHTSFRSGDIICRIGGDEFALILNGLSSEQKEQLENKLTFVMHKLGEADSDAPAFTLSIGVAFGSEKDNFKILYKKADQALYSIKTTSKNGIGFCEE